MDAEDDVSLSDLDAEFDQFENEFSLEGGETGGGGAAGMMGTEGIEDTAAQGFLYPAEVDVKAVFPDSDDQAVPRICNSICYVNLGVPIDLRKLACGACYVEFNPKRNAGAIMRIKEPPCVAIIRNSGTMIITGASSVGAAKRAAELAGRVVRKVLQLGDRLNQIIFRVKSLSVRFDLKHPVRLEDLHMKHQDICSYEPETFCGCIVKLRGPPGNPWRVAANVFVSGKVTFVGARTTDEITWAYHSVLPLIAPFAKGADPAALPQEQVELQEPPAATTATVAGVPPLGAHAHSDDGMGEEDLDFDLDDLP